MPPVDHWESLFDVPLILNRMGIDRNISSLVEIGCGYGTFTSPAAHLIDPVRGYIRAFDIDPEMVEVARERLRRERRFNVAIDQKDVLFVNDRTANSLTEATLIEDGSIDYVMLFNVLHHDRPAEFLELAWRWLRPGGRAGIIHWRYDERTPRGPAMDIRPRPEQLTEAARDCGFYTGPANPLDLPPYHYGIIAEKPTDPSGIQLRVDYR